MCHYGRAHAAHVEPAARRYERLRGGAPRPPVEHAVRHYGRLRGGAPRPPIVAAEAPNSDGPALLPDEAPSPSFAHQIAAAISAQFPNLIAALPKPDAKPSPAKPKAPRQPNKPDIDCRWEEGCFNRLLKLDPKDDNADAPTRRLCGGRSCGCIFFVCSNRVPAERPLPLLTQVNMAVEDVEQLFFAWMRASWAGAAAGKKPRKATPAGGAAGAAAGAAAGMGEDEVTAAHPVPDWLKDAIAEARPSRTRASQATRDQTYRRPHPRCSRGAGH